MHPIKLSEKTYYYDPEFRALFEDEKRTRIVKTRFFSDSDYAAYMQQIQIIHQNIKPKNQ